MSAPFCVGEHLQLKVTISGSHYLALKDLLSQKSRKPFHFSTFTTTSSTTSTAIPFHQFQNNNTFPGWYWIQHQRFLIFFVLSHRRANFKSRSAPLSSDSSLRGLVQSPRTILDLLRSFSLRPQPLHQPALRVQLSLPKDSLRYINWPRLIRSLRVSRARHSLPTVRL